MKLKKDWGGQKVGMLTVLERTARPKGLRSHAVYWKCRCDCGNDTVTTSQHLQRAANPPNCGCVVYSGNVKNRRYDDPKEVSINFIMRNYQDRAGRRALRWDLTRRQFKELVFGDCYWCGTPPCREFNIYKSRNRNPKRKRNATSKEWADKATIVTNGIDRVDNSLGYTVKNTVPCCTICNKAKLDLSEQDFLEWVNRIYHFQRNRA